jgi:hypothetical protein
MYVDPWGKEHRYGPPAGWVQPEHQSLGPAEWDELVARGLQFAPYDGPAILLSTFGNCLSPLLEGGQHYLSARPMAPDEVPIDGGLYVVEPENQEEIRRLCKDRLGRSISGIVSITKFLRYVASEWWLVNREGIDPLGIGRVIYEVVGIIPLNDVAQIAANAASQMASNYSAPTVTTSAGPGVTVNAAIISVTVTTSSFPTAIDAGATIQASAVTGGILSTCLLSIYRDGAIVPSSQFDVTTVFTAGTNYVQNMMLSATDTPPAGTHTYELHLTLKNGGAAGIATLASWANFIKVREIKK